MEDGSEVCRKKIKCMPNSEDIKKCILDTKEPVILRNILSWDLLKWSLGDWTEQLDNPKLDVRMGTTQCTKVPQWENSCEAVSVSLKQLLEPTNNEQSTTWMYFDYKHMKQYFRKKTELLEAITWADFGFPDKNGKDSTIWIGTKGAYTPCHMDSYGSNIVAQVYGRKQWVMFPPRMTSALKPIRVPYEESSIYSNIHFACGLNVPEDMGEARVAELSPGDVLIVPKHWWHYVENLTTAISINMWIPKESDHLSRLEESLVRYFVAMTLKNMGVEGETPLLNPNEIDLLEEPVDLRQISWCAEQVLVRKVSREDAEDSSSTRHQSCGSTVSSLTAGELRQLLLKKCGCVEEEHNFTGSPQKQKFSAEDIINAFCHPDVISKVAELLVSSQKS